MIRLQPERKALSAKMIRNVAFGGMRALLLAPVPFVMTPLILSKVGTRGYGTWAVFVALNGFTSLVDLGLLGTLSKYVAEHYAHGDFGRLNRLLNTGLVVFTVLASVLVAGLWIVSGPLVNLMFHGSALGLGELRFLFHCALILVWINVVTLFSSSVTSGLQRLDLANILSAFNILSAAIVGATLLLRGWGISGLLYANIGSAALTLFAYSWLIHRLLPQFTLDPFQADKVEARRIFGFSLQIYVTQAAGAIHNQIEKLLLAFFVGVVPVGWYDIAGDVSTKLRSAPQLLLGPVLPAASELNARGEGDKLVELYYRTHKYLAFLSIPLVCFAVAMAGQFVNLWIGTGLHFIALPLEILLIVNLFNLLTGPGYLILAGRGILWPGMYSALIGVVLNLVLSSALIYTFGFAGAVTGTSISLITASLIFFYLFHRETRSSLSRLLREAYLKPLGCSLLLVAILAFVLPAANLTWIGLALRALVFAVAYTGLLLCSNFFDQYDWTKLQSAVPVIRIARRVAPVA